MGRRKNLSVLIFGWLVYNGLFSTPLPALAQAAVDVRFTGEKINDTILVVYRKKTLADKSSGVSFKPVSLEPLVFRITDVKTPEPATLHFNKTDLPVFLVPGVRLVIMSSRMADGTLAWKQEGPAAMLNKEFDSIFSTSWPGFVQAYEKAGSSERLQLFNTALGNNASLRQTPVKDYFNYRLMRLALDSSSSLLTLNDHHTVWKRWLPDMLNNTLKNDIENLYQAKLRALISEQSGKTAASFSLPDSAGKMHRLADFKGRLVYLDLWASWCLPCRLESPIIQRLVSRYKQNPGIVFIGIAVSDKPADWKKALRQDKPGWLQLHDKNTLVANAYAATSVPRYVLIDKDGKIIDFHAPGPTDYQRLIDTIEKELEH